MGISANTVEELLTLCKNDNMKTQSRFNIDFLKLFLLAESCIPPTTIARETFWEILIDTYYHELTVKERVRLHEWINRNIYFEDGIKNRNEDCLLFNARFDQNNQYSVTTIFNNETTVTNCFKWENKYHLSKNKSVNGDYITSAIKIPAI